MKVLSQTQVKQVSGGESLIDAIHRNEWNSYGVPLINGGIFAWNLLVPTAKLPYVKKIAKPA
jgi:hypothetical protein